MDDARCDMLGKGFVVLDKEHGRLKFFNEIFDLNARKKIDEVERTVHLGIFQKRRLLFNRPLPPLFDGLGALHHLGGLVPDIPSGRLQARMERPKSGLLHGVRPARRAALRLLQAADLPLQFVVLPPLPKYT